MSRIAFVGVAVVVASVLAAAEQPPSVVSAITAAQQHIDRGFANAVLSPFTAVASKYFSPGDAARLVVHPDGVSLDLASASGGAASLQFDGRAIRVTPLAGGGPLRLLHKSGEDGI